MNIISRVLGSLEARLNQPRLSLWRTVYFNFRTMPFHTAIKLPVFIYGKVRLFMLNGKVVFENTAIRRGMVKIGVNGDSFSLFDHTGYVQLGNKESVIIFNGPCRIALNVKLRVISGTLRLGQYVRIGSDSRIICNGADMIIGDFTGITFGCTIMNSSFHYTYDVNNKGYCNRSSMIEIGKRNWIGNQTTITGNCKTKDNTIVGTGSLLNKDYTSNPIEYVLLAGRPAKVARVGIKRVFSPSTEVKVNSLFYDKSKCFIHSEEFIDDSREIEQEM